MFKVNDETFTFQGKEILSQGFTKVYPFTVISSSDQIPQVTVNSTYSIAEVGANLFTLINCSRVLNILSPNAVVLFSEKAV